MAFAGVHVACGYAGAKNYPGSDVPIPGECVWSQTFAAGSSGATSQAAPKSDPERSEAIFSIDTSIDIFFAVGSTPDATIGPRRLLMAGRSADVFVRLGDKLAWIAA